MFSKKYIYIYFIYIYTHTYACWSSGTSGSLQSHEAPQWEEWSIIWARRCMRLVSSDPRVAQHQRHVTSSVSYVNFSFIVLGSSSALDVNAPCVCVCVCSTLPGNSQPHTLASSAMRGPRASGRTAAAQETSKSRVPRSRRTRWNLNLAPVHRDVRMTSLPSANRFQEHDVIVCR